MYKLLFALPSQPSYILGFFRTVAWVIFLCYFNFEALNKSVDDNWLLLPTTILPFVGIGYLLVSFAIMFGFRYPMEYGGRDRTIPGLENHPNIQSTMDIMDSQLSSYKTRSNFIDSFLNQK